MIKTLSYVNLALRFVLELCALAALGYWGWHAAEGLLLRAVLAIGTPVLAAVLWGAYVAPKAPLSVPRLARLGVEIAVFSAAGAGLWVTGQRAAAEILTALYIVNRLLIALWEA